MESIPVNFTIMDPWDRLVHLCRGTFSESNLLSLYWETLRGLCEHYRITSPVDVALIELHWKSNQGSREGPRRGASPSPERTTERLHQPRQSSKPPSRHVDPAVLTTCNAIRAAIKVAAEEAAADQPRRSLKSPSRHVDPPVVTATVGSDHHMLLTQPLMIMSNHDSSAPQAEGRKSNRSSSAPREVRKVGPDLRGLLPPRDPCTATSGLSPPRSRPWGVRGPRPSSPHSTVVPPSDLRPLFDAFTSFSSTRLTGGIDIVKCVKLFRDCGLTNRSTLTSQDVEILFAKARRIGEKKMLYSEFRMMLIPEAANRLGISVAELVRVALQCSGPNIHSSVTKAVAVRLHDDKGTYTGTQRARATHDSPE